LRNTTPVQTTPTQATNGNTTTGNTTPRTGGSVSARLASRSAGDELPNKHGQVFREYSIRDYTSRVTTTAKPEQAIVDWILRETGTDVWFGEPLGFFTATKDKVVVYHTPEMQEIVAGVIDRFVSASSDPQVLGLRIISVGSPNWRSQAHRLLHPVDVQTPGIDAWLISKENAAILLAQLSKRADYKEHASPNLVMQNGQSETLSRIQPQSFFKDVRIKSTFPGYELETGNVEQGYSLQISPLFSVDGRTLDAVIKCHVDQIERMVPIQIEAPTGTAQSQSVQVSVPQMSSYRLHERFRWPADQVLLVSAGVAPTPGAAKKGLLDNLNPFDASVPRADALLFIESRGKASQGLLTSPRPSAETATPGIFSGRY